MTTTPMDTKSSAKTITPANEKSLAASSAQRVSEDSKQQSKMTPLRASNASGGAAKSQGTTTPAPESSIVMGTSDEVITRNENASSLQVISSPDIMTPGGKLEKAITRNQGVSFNQTVKVKP